MAKFPAFQFYVKDWLSDDKLRLCSLAARGMWIDMLCLMYNSEERGVLVTGGTPWTDDQIVYAVSCPDRIEDRHAALAELKQHYVAKVDTRGAVFNARMVHDEHIRQVRSDAGSKGGKICSSKTSSKTQAKLKQTTAVCSMQNAEGINGGTGGKPNPIWDEVCRLFNLKPVTKAERTRIGQVVRDLKAKSATVPQIAVAFAWCREKFDPFGPEALVKWFDQAVSQAPPPTRCRQVEKSPAERAAESEELQRIEAERIRRDEVIAGLDDERLLQWKATVIGKAKPFVANKWRDADPRTSPTLKAAIVAEINTGKAGE